MSSEEERVMQTGIEIFDLRPTGSMMPNLSAMRDARRRVVPRFTVPPVPEGSVRVELGDDYYAGAVWSRWRSVTGDTADNPAWIFDLPADQVERWEKAQADYAAMQAEIEALRATRLAGPPGLPAGWVRKEPYQVQP